MDNKYTNINMHCPDDGKEMVGTDVVTLDKSWRCRACGGCLVDGWVINAIAGGKPLKITEMENRKIVIKNETWCPEDGMGMFRGGGDNLPDEVEIWKCEKCKKWWLPGNSIFELARAFGVRKEYLHTWGKKRDLSVFALPVVLTIVLLLGLGMILNQVRLRQLWQTQAAVVRSTNVRYLGNGQAEVKLSVSGDLGVVEFRLEGEDIWQPAPVVSQGEWQVAVVNGVVPGDKFLLRWNKGVVLLTVGQQE